MADEMRIEPGLIEKDYYIMHSLYGLTLQGFVFELKGGTSLSKGFQIIDRFSEDIDIHIHPDPSLEINENRNNTKPKNIEKRLNFYDQLAKDINIPGIASVERDIAFDDTRLYLNGGIRFNYDSLFPAVAGIKEGILLEAGFDTVTPNLGRTISSWAFDKAKAEEVQVLDNRAINIKCYHPGYTFVEKLQTIATKFRREQETGAEGQNFMRQYYDVANLLQNDLVSEFIGTKEYIDHKVKRFPKVDHEIPISENQAFLLSDSTLRERFKVRYKLTKNLYYKGQPDFDHVLSVTHANLTRL